MPLPPGNLGRLRPLVQGLPRADGAQGDRHPADQQPLRGLHHGRGGAPGGADHPRVPRAQPLAPADADLGVHRAGGAGRAAVQEVRPRHHHAARGRHRRLRPRADHQGELPGAAGLPAGSQERPPPARQPPPGPRGDRPRVRLAGELGPAAGADQEPRRPHERGLRHRARPGAGHRPGRRLARPLLLAPAHPVSRDRHPDPGGDGGVGQRRAPHLPHAGPAQDPARPHLRGGGGALRPLPALPAGGAVGRALPARRGDGRPGRLPAARAHPRGEPRPAAAQPEHRGVQPDPGRAPAGGFHRQVLADAQRRDPQLLPAVPRVRGLRLPRPGGPRDRPGLQPPRHGAPAADGPGGLRGLPRAAQPLLHLVPGPLRGHARRQTQAGEGHRFRRRQGAQRLPRALYPRTAQGHPARHHHRDGAGPLRPGRGLHQDRPRVARRQGARPRVRLHPAEGERRAAPPLRGGGHPRPEDAGHQHRGLRRLHGRKRPEGARHAGGPRRRDRAGVSAGPPPGLAHAGPVGLRRIHALPAGRAVLEPARRRAVPALRRHLPHLHAGQHTTRTRRGAWRRSSRRSSSSTPRPTSRARSPSPAAPTTASRRRRWRWPSST